jgi:DNA-binding LytR/AlgR family response regulator
MSESTARFLIVEDEMIIGANISLQLSNLGHEVSAIIPRGEEAIQFLKENSTDIVLMDINLNGKLDGVETAKIIQQQHDIPIIFITANSDEANFNRAKSTRPYAFISKPFKKIDLQRAIELTLSRMEHLTTGHDASPAENQNALVQSDSIFVRHHDKMVKIMISDILYVEAERNYCRIYTIDRAYLLVITLKELDERLPGNHFIRIHRSYIVNISRINEVGNMHVSVGNKNIPLSKSYREELMQRLQTI